MPRFYFHTEDGPMQFRDEVGVELPDVAAARVEAADVMGQLLKDAAVEFWASGHLLVAVESADPVSGFTLRATAGRN